MKKSLFIFFARFISFCLLLIAHHQPLSGQLSSEIIQKNLVEVLQKRSLNRVKGTFIQVFFPLIDEVRSIICELIEAETQRIDVEAFQFTDRAIAEALLQAHYRGVKIRLIIDMGALNRFNKVIKLRNEGIAVEVYPKDGNSTGYSIMHNKIILLYSLSCVVTGSMNLTTAGIEKNHENLLIIQDELVFEQYAYQFNCLLNYTMPLGPSLNL